MIMYIFHDNVHVFVVCEGVTYNKKKKLLEVNILQVAKQRSSSNYW